ncbi:MAG TPA: hypothetical protein VFA60_07615 [Terriglobales bacterium]|nr:hypothetical protein [Terriglobales bacterium]
MQRQLLLAAMLGAVSVTAAGQTSAPAAPPPALAAGVAASAAVAPPDPKELIRKAAENDEENDRRQRNYTYIQRVEEHKLDGSGNTRSVETKTYEIMVLYGEPIERLIEKNDKPLPPDEAEKEEKRVNKIAEKRKNEGPGDRKKRLEKEEKEREESRAFDKELAEAYIFTLVGQEVVNGRPAWVIKGDPRPGYQPKLKGAKVLPKIRGQVWIDQQDSQFVKGDLEVIDTISWGGFIARVHKGTRFHFEQTRVNDEVWLPQLANVHVDARLLLFKGFNLNLNIAYRDYRKFRTESRVLGVVGEASDPPPPAPAAPPQL